MQLVPVVAQRAYTHTGFFHSARQPLQRQNNNTKRARTTRRLQRNAAATVHNNNNNAHAATRLRRCRRPFNNSSCCSSAAAAAAAFSRVFPSTDNNLPAVAVGRTDAAARPAVDHLTQTDQSGRRSAPGYGRAVFFSRSSVSSVRVIM